MVQLKVIQLVGTAFNPHISIPYGSIKRAHGFSRTLYLSLFQFLMVQLKE